jgi:hypothetical protein
VLTNASGLDPAAARELTAWSGVRVGQCLGLYHPVIPGYGGRASTPAWIEIFLDNVLDRHVNVFVETLVLFVGPSARLAETLYHEVGHHIHERFGPEHGNPERHAERWGQRLFRRFLVRKRPWLSLAMFPAFLLGWTWRILWFSHEASFCERR